MAAGLTVIVSIGYEVATVVMAHTAIYMTELQKHSYDHGPCL
jgi:hypothetical protein